MKNRPHRFPVLVFLLLMPVCGILRAQPAGGWPSDQNYPVTATAFIAAQPNQKLSAYFSSDRALTVSLVLKDLTKSSLQVYLRWSLEGPGVRVSSMDGYIPANFINLERGAMRRMSGLELQQDYFRQHVIQEEGLSGTALRTSLPEGFYTFRVQALEAGTGREVSNLGETYFSVTTPLPPVINVPFNGASLRPAQGPPFKLRGPPFKLRGPPFKLRGPPCKLRGVESNRSSGCPAITVCPATRRPTTFWSVRSPTVWNPTRPSTPA